MLLAILYWDPQQSGGTNLGGSGTWVNGGSTACWYNPSSGLDVTWNNSNGDTAVFSGTAAGVTVSGTVSAGSLQFQATNYSLSGGTLSLATGGTTVQESGTDSATISSAITGSAALTESGPGTVTLTGSNSYSGGTNIVGGEVSFASGSLGSSGSIDFTGNGTLQWNGSNTQDISSRLAINSGASATLDTESNTVTLGTAFGASGSGSLAKVGSGTLILPATETYTGTTTVSAGTLQLGNGTSNGSVAGSISDGSTLTWMPGGSLSYAGTISGAGGVTMSGSGTLTLTGSNSYGGGTTIAGGEVSFANGSLGSSGSIDFTGNGTLQWNGSNTQDVSSRLAINNGVNATLNVGSNTVTLATPFGASGSGSLTMAGSGTLILPASETYTGTTTVSAGTLQLGNGTSSGSVAGNISDNSTLAWMPAGSLTYGGVISGYGSVSQSSSGTLVLTGTNTYTGQTTVSSGTLQLGNGTLNGSVAGNISTSSGSNVVYQPYSSVTYSGVISGSGSMTMSGSGTLTLTGTNTYTGTTTVSAGTLQLGNGTSNGSVAGNISVGATLTWMPANSLTYGGVMSGSGTVTKSGSGTLTLTGTNTYTGLTTVSTGALQLGNGSTSGSVAGNISNGSSVVFMPNGSLSYGGTISGSGSVSQSGSGTLTLTGSNSYSGGTTIAGGTVSFANGSLGSSGAITFSGNGTLQWNGSNTQDVSSRLAITGGVNATLNVGSNTVTLATPFGASGSGAVTKAGSGTLILPVSETYTGTTTVSAGTLQLGNGTTSGSLAGNISVGSTLTWMPAGTLTYGGVISGSAP